MRFFLLPFMLVFLVSPAMTQGGDIPYIHYFDHLRGGLVIERADGADSRILLGLPSGVPQWSPSGKWMAVGREIWSTDGKTQRIFLDSTVKPWNDGLLLWAPSDDVILIAFTIYHDMNNTTLQAQLYDVETQRLLNDTTYPAPRGEGFSISDAAYWEADGSAATFAFSKWLYTLKRDGTSVIWYESQDLLYPRFSDGRHIYTVVNQEIDFPRIMQDEGGSLRLEVEQPYSVSQNPVFKDFAILLSRSCNTIRCKTSIKRVNWATRQITPVNSMGLGEISISHFRWSPTGRYVWLGENPFVESFYILDVFTGEVQRLAIRANIAWSNWQRDGKFYFVYEGQDKFIVYEPFSRKEYILPLPRLLFNADIPALEVHVSPDGQYIGLRSDPAAVIDKNGNVIAKSAMHSRSAFTSGEFRPRGYIWSEDSQWVMASYVLYYRSEVSGLGGVQVLFNLAGTKRRELPSAGNAGFVPRRAMPYLSIGERTSSIKEPLLMLAQEGRVDGVGWHPTDPNRLVTYSELEGLIFWSLHDQQAEIEARISIVGRMFEANPGGYTLHWNPEQNAVGFHNRASNTFQRINLETGRIETDPQSDYPILMPDGNSSVIQRDIFDEAISVDWDLSAPYRYGFQSNLTSGKTGLIVSNFDNYRYKSGNIDIVVNWLTAMEAKNAYIDAVTGNIVPLQFNNNVYTSDARNGIAALGSAYLCCVTIVSTENGQRIDQFYGTAVSLAISADGRRLATTSAGMTAIWDTSMYLVND